MLGIDSLYEVIEKKENSIVVKLASCTHPIFQAHFPNNHLLPGFCHIEILSLLLQDKIKKIRLFKLQNKTLPEDKVYYQIQTTGQIRKVQIIKQNKQLVGKLQYEY